MTVFGADEGTFWTPTPTLSSASAASLGATETTEAVGASLTDAVATVRAGSESGTLTVSPALVTGDAETLDTVAIISVIDGFAIEAFSSTLMLSEPSATGRRQVTVSEPPGIVVNPSANKAVVQSWENHVVLTSGNQIVVLDISGVTVTNSGREGTD